MKKSLVLSLCLLCALVLCACGDTAASQDNTAYVGNYVCTGITMDGLAMNPEGKWLELHADGTATTFLTAASNEAEWQLSGEAFTMTIAGKTVATGTLQSNQLTLEMSGMEYTFAREGTQPQEGDSDSGTYATFTCYGGLYSVRYASDVFQPDPAGLSDLYTNDGTKGWITKTGQRGAGHRVAGQLRCQRDQRDRHRLSNHGPHSGRLFRPGHCLPG